ncbi:MAG: hypothetical protein AB1806_12855 [Acidobacteriota bacterium]
MRMKVVLTLVFVVFIGFLIALVIIARKANPIMLDEAGRPRNAPSTAAPHD